MKIYKTPNGSESEFSPIWNKTAGYLSNTAFSSKGNKMLYTSYSENYTSLFTLPSSTPEWTKTFIQPICQSDHSINEEGSLVIFRTYETGKQGIYLLNGTNEDTIWSRYYPSGNIESLMLSDKNNVFSLIQNEKRLEKINLQNETVWNINFSYFAVYVGLAKNESLMVVTDTINSLSIIDPTNGIILHNKTFTDIIQNVIVSEDGKRIIVALQTGGITSKYVSISPTTYEIVKESSNLPRGRVLPLDEQLDNFLVYSDGLSNAFFVMDTASMSVKFNRTLSVSNDARSTDSCLSTGVFGSILMSGHLFLFSTTRELPPAPPTPTPTLLEELSALFSKPVNWIGLGVMALFGFLIGALVGKKRK